jgi:hypothetical protein
MLSINIVSYLLLIRIKSTGLRNIRVVSCVCVGGGVDSMIWFIDTYTFTQFGTTGNYSAIAILHALQFTVAHALGFSVFTSRILATDLLQSSCHFKWHMKSSLHRLIPLFPFLLSNLQLVSPELDRVLVNNLLLPWNFSLYSLWVDPTKNTVFYYPVLF